MALIKSSQGILSGSIGADTFSRNRYGTYVRRRSNPVNPATGNQAIARTDFTNVSQAWSTLTSSNRALWEDYASQTPQVNRLGDQIFLSGQAWHQKLNSFRAAASVALATVPPTTPGEGNSPQIDDAAVTIVQTGPVGNLVPSADWNTLNYDDSVDSILSFWYSPALSAGVTFYNGPWHRWITPSAGLIGGLALASDPIIGTDPPAPVKVTNGEFRMLQVRQMDKDGKLSPLSRSGIKLVSI